MVDHKSRKLRPARTVSLSVIGSGTYRLSAELAEAPGLDEGVVELPQVFHRDAARIGPVLECRDHVGNVVAARDRLVPDAIEDIVGDVTFLFFFVALGQARDHRSYGSLHDDVTVPFLLVKRSAIVEVFCSFVHVVSVSTAIRVLGDRHNDRSRGKNGKREPDGMPPGVGMPDAHVEVPMGTMMWATRGWVVTMISHPALPTLLDKMVTLLLSLDELRQQPLLLIADAYYASRKVILPLLAQGNQLVTRARVNTVAYLPVSQPAKRRRGRPKLYGKKVRLRELAADISRFKTAPSPIDGDHDRTELSVAALRWVIAIIGIGDRITPESVIAIPESVIEMTGIRKYRKKRIYGEIRRRLGEVLRRLAEQRESRVEEGHLMPDHVHMMLSIPPKYSVSQVIGYMKGKSANHIASSCCRYEESFEFDTE